MPAERRGNGQGPPIAAGLVLIGGSAGGVEALSTLVNQLPEDFRAASVIREALAASLA